MRTQEYMEGLVLQSEKVKLQESMVNIIKDFRNEGFEDEDIYDYMKDVMITLLHKQTLNKIEDLLKREREIWIKNNLK